MISGVVLNKYRYTSIYNIDPCEVVASSTARSNTMHVYKDIAPFIIDKLVKNFKLVDTESAMYVQSTAIVESKYDVCTNYTIISLVKPNKKITCMSVTSTINNHFSSSTSMAVTSSTTQKDMLKLLHPYVAGDVVNGIYNYSSS